MWSTCIDVCHTWTTTCLASELHRPMCMSFKLTVTFEPKLAYDYLLMYNTCTRDFHTSPAECTRLAKSVVILILKGLNYTEGVATTFNTSSAQPRSIHHHSHVSRRHTVPTTAVCFRKRCDNAETWPPHTMFASTTVTETPRFFRRPTAHPY
jgi:hypothetical protein